MYFVVLYRYQEIIYSISVAEPDHLENNAKDDHTLLARKTYITAIFCSTLHNHATKGFSVYKSGLQQQEVWRGDHLNFVRIVGTRKIVASPQN